MQIKFILMPWTKPKPLPAGTYAAETVKVLRDGDRIEVTVKLKEEIKP